jgi:single-strand DNA-binding protein
MSFNLAVVRGACSSAPELRTLESGSTLAVLQITAREPDAPTTSVPVVMWDPPEWVGDLDSGDEVIAVGRVRRRFYRAGAAAASKVELEADYLAPANDRRRVKTALRRARDQLSSADA